MHPTDASAPESEASPGSSRRVTTLALAAAALLALPASAAAAGPCPNASLRAGLSAALPECRAYELVSNAFTNNKDVVGGFVLSDGDHVSYGTISTEGGVVAESGGGWLAERTPNGWTSTNVELPGVEPTELGGVDTNGASHGPFAFNEDGSQELYITVHALSPLDTNEQMDLYKGSLQGGFAWLTDDALRGDAYNGKEPYWELMGATPDLSTAVFEAHERLTANAPTQLVGEHGTLGEGQGREIYQWRDGELSLVSLLPGEASGAPGGATVGASAHGSGDPPNAVSANGSTVFFASPDYTYNKPNVPPQLYARIDGQRTVEVSAPAPGVSDPNGEQEAIFRGATPSGSRVFFTSDGALTGNANTRSDERADLYMYELGSETLTDISSAGLIDPNGSQVQGVVGVSENGEMVYFVAQGVLAGANGEHKQPVEGGENLYLWHTGTITYVATLSEKDESSLTGVWGLNAVTRSADVTPDGEHLAVISDAKLTGYESDGRPEMYAYSAEEEKMTCVSCNSTGAPPTGEGIDIGASVAQGLLGGTSRFMSNDGSILVFASAERLLPAAANGQVNVYEYTGGLQYLLSTGTSSSTSVVRNMTPNGADIFFNTRQPLAGGAQGENEQLYDARVDGGFPEEAAAPVACRGVECQPSAIPPPALAVPTSALFGAEGDIAHTTPGKRHASPREIRKKKARNRALKRCRRIHRHNRHKLRACMRRARKRDGANGARAGHRGRHRLRRHTGGGKRHHQRRGK